MSPKAASPAMQSPSTARATDDPRIPINNLRTLLRNISEGFDLRLDTYRIGTRYESVRRSDVRVFFLAMREPRTTAELARVIGISRQAVQKSVQRLIALDVLSMQDIAGNKRDKLVVFTDRGKQASHAAAEMLTRLEDEVARVVGAEDMEKLRDILTRIDAVFSPESMRLKQREITAPRTATPRLESADAD